MGSWLPVASVAWILTTCGPRGRRPYCRGERQSTHGPWSSRHRNVESGSLDWNAKRGVRFVIRPWGPRVMTVCGGVESTVNDREAGAVSAFPAASVAATENVWSPSASGVVRNGEVHFTATPPSSRHAKVEPGSFEVKRNTGAFSIVRGSGLRVIVVSGGAVSVNFQLKV